MDRNRKLARATSIHWTGIPGIRKKRGGAVMFLEGNDHQLATVAWGTLC